MWKQIILNGIKTNYEVNELGEVRNIRTKYKLKLQMNRNGYLEAHIYFKAKNRPLLVNRLVAKAFIPNPLNKEEVNHIDGIKINNHITNLEWCTREENMQHSWRIGLRHKMLGYDNPSTKIRKWQVHNICKFLEKGIFPKEISEKTGISVDIIKSIKYKQSWVDISNQYNIPKSLKHVDYSKYHYKIDELIRKGYKSKEIRSIYKIKDIPKRDYINLIKNRRKALKHKERSTTKFDGLKIEL